ncbi:MAG: hypothetical protein RIB60_04795 [Phycisphaerales bacterium]
MPESARAIPTLESPADRARGLFTAVLESWAGDCLRLRAKGLDRPSWRTHTAGLDRPLGVRRPTGETTPTRRAA